MYGHINIKRSNRKYTYRTDEYDRIYDRLRALGYDHESAEDVASWAELELVGNHYTTDNDDEIYICE